MSISKRVSTATGAIPMSVDQTTLDEYNSDLPALPPADEDELPTDDEEYVRWRDYGVDLYDPYNGDDDGEPELGDGDAGISESGALAILNRPALTDWAAEEILTEEERTKGEEASDHSFSQ